VSSGASESRSSGTRSTTRSGWRTSALLVRIAAMSVTGASLGFHLLNHIRGESIIQVGFALGKSAWGKGFATEMAAAVLRYGFVDLKLPSIAGMANVQNHASQRVLLKIGLERRGERAFPHPDYAAEGAMAWFEREAAAWQAERGSG